MSIKTVTKRDGTISDFNVNKILGWEVWACKDVKDYINWKSIIIKVLEELYEGIKTQDIQLKLIDECNNRKTWYHSIVAGRLYTAYISKKIIDDCYKDVDKISNEKYTVDYPSVKNLQKRLIDLGLIKDLGYTDEEYEQIENIIDHSRDFNLAYSQIKQIVHKYAISNKSTRTIYETPQFTFMRMAMALSYDEENRLEKVDKFYNFFSKFKINAPTPNYANLGTNHNGFISCCLYTTDDNAASLAIGDHIAYTMTYMSSGIGGFINCRSINDEVKGGLIKHMGKLPYFKSVAAQINANLQSSRGGACTEYFMCYDPEVMDIIYLQNPRTPLIKQNRDIHFAMQFNTFFVEKVYKDEDIFLFNKHTAPDLVEAFFSGDKDLFKSIYESYEKNDNFKKTYISARKIAIESNKQSHEVATLYSINIDEINRHTSFKEPIYSSNVLK